MNRRTLIACLAASTFASRALSAENGLTPLTAALRKGGLVIVLRHASSPTAIPSKEEAAPGNFGPERQLDAKGRDDATAMGEAFRRLGIKISAVLSSPAYRAIETVRYAQFGIPLPTRELGDDGQGMAANVEEERRAWLRRKVTEAAPAGGNLLLVTHAPNMTGA